MNKLLSNLKWFPEFYFILVSVSWFYFSQNNSESYAMINFPAIIMIVVFHIQLFLNDELLGKFLAGIIALASLYMIGAVIVEYDLLADFSYENQINTLKYGNIILINFIMSLWMFWKYSNQLMQAPAEIR